MRHLFAHLHTNGRVCSYLRLLIGRHRQFIAFVIVVIAALIGVTQYQKHAIAREHAVQAKAFSRDREAQIKSCQRVQILRDQTNGLALLAYDAWQKAADREQQLIKGDPNNAKKHRHSYHDLVRTTHTIVVTGPTDCRLAVDIPDKYRAPAPEFVYKGGPHIKEARQRSQAIITKAKLGKPLYGP